MWVRITSSYTFAIIFRSECTIAEERPLNSAVVMKILLQ